MRMVGEDAHAFSRVPKIELSVAVIDTPAGAGWEQTADIFSAHLCVKSGERSIPALKNSFF